MTAPSPLALPHEASPSAPCNTRRTAVLLALIVAVALAARVAAIVHLKSWRYPNPAEHRSIALSLIGGQGFSFGAFGYYGPSSVQSPTYPLLLAGLFDVFGADTPGAYVGAMLINALAGALSAWLVYLLVRTMGGDEPTGLLAALACAVWPSQVYAVAHAQAIALVIAATLAIVVLYYRSLHGGGLGTWIAFSLIGTVAALTEPVLLPMMALSGILVLVWRSRLTLGQRIRNAGILLAAALLVIGPWTVRNRLVHGQWIPIKSTFWVNVWKANNDHATGTDRPAITPEQQRLLESQQWTQREATARGGEIDNLRQYDLLSAEDRQRLESKTEAQREAIFKEWSVSWIGAHPQRYVELCFVRLGKTLWVDWDNPKSYSLLYTGPRALLLALTVPGMVLALRRRWALLYPALLVGSCLLTYTLTITAARFSLPLEPMQMCVAALVIVEAVRWCRSKLSELVGETQAA